MNKVMTWQQIEEEHNGQWVQLVDYDWPEEETYPRTGKVRLSAPTRKEFNRLVLEKEPVDAARIYVGEHKLPEGSIISSNITRIISCGQ